MAPLTPTWKQPSHPAIQEVIFTANKDEFTSKSLSKISVPPFGVFATLDFPPCTIAADGATYATVQMGRDTHLNLNSDLVYINHSCEPSLIFDLNPTQRAILAGPRGLSPGDELTFFYPSTEWSMAQAFDCFCGAPTCRGRISGARDMSAPQLAGTWLNGFIRALLAERDGHASAEGFANGNGKVAVAAAAAASADAKDDVEGSLLLVLEHAGRTVRLAEEGLSRYRKKVAPLGRADGAYDLVAFEGKGTTDAASTGAARGGPTSRELSGEMGGDTSAVSAA